MAEKSKTAEQTQIEMRWQERWAEDGLYDSDLEATEKPRYYFLTMLPYPSGDLHMGHWFTLGPTDTRARYLRMTGHNVFLPIGFDAFGLPAENAAIRHNLHPAKWTYSNIDNMRRQLRAMGASFPWANEVVTCDPEYYRWNQWFFQQFYKRGLAYRKFAPVDWCPSCNTTLAREQVVGDERRCERCDTPVIKKELFQWFLKITDYAEELLDFSQLDWPERVRTLQHNWIGRSEGAHIRFAVQGHEGEQIEVFTTRPDTLWGATFMVLAPEHPLVAKLITDDCREKVEAYVQQTARHSETERSAEGRERTGEFTGAYAINPANGRPIAVWIADYVLPDYGSGAIMAVPAHDTRDFEFARAFDLPVEPVIRPREGDALQGDEMSEAFSSHDGVMIHSGPLDGLQAGPGEGRSIAAAIAWLEAEGQGQGAVTYRLRDWLISRQRYWGTPIPVVYCDDCGEVLVPEEQLPLELPDDVDFVPTGKSPLHTHPTWRNTECPKCGGPAERETDTMDTFVDSSWYQYRYLSPHYEDGPFDPKTLDWLPITQYTGGIEHAVMHLMYTRFWTKAMRDLGLVSFDEPMLRLFNQGIILGPDGKRMSKSRGNVIDPDELVRRYGADAVRCFVMFLGPWDQGGPWNPRGIEGIVRWFSRLRDAASTSTEGEAGAPEALPAAEVGAAREVQRKLHQTIAEVGAATDDFRFNSAISRMMELTTLLLKTRDELGGSELWRFAMRDLLLMLAPYAPHLAEELWSRRGHEYSIHQRPWPEASEELAAEDSIELVIQVNGRLRDRLQVPVGCDRRNLEERALAAPNAIKFMDGKSPRKVIVVPDKLVNIVV